jgi:gliding motility-associated protein GldL
MGLKKITRSRGFKNFMSKLYGIGAAIVIMGALFKINHYPGADIMLIVGLTTESIIFFFSAFEPPHIEPDWSLVYPELSYLYHGGDKPAIAQSKGRPSAQGGVTQELDKLLSDAKIGPELISSLGDGLKKFSDQASQLSKVTNAAVASEEFTSNMKAAGGAMGKFAEASKKTSELMEKDAEAAKELSANVRTASQKVAELSGVYAEASATVKADLNATGEFAKAIKQATQSANQLSQNYTQSAEQIAKSAEMLDLSKIDGADYNAQLKKISGNLNALNTVYELQIKEMNQQLAASTKLQGSFNQFLSNVSDSAENMNKYKTEVDALTRKISALNNVYGNMLAAMNVSAK